MSGRSKGRQGLAHLPIPLTAKLTVVACKAGEGFIRELFEPLGYRVVAQQPPARREVSLNGATDLTTR